MMNQITSAQKFLTAISLLALFLMCSLPFLIPIHRSPISTFYGEFIAVALGILASVFMLQRGADQPFHFPLFILAPLGLIIIFALQVGFGLANYLATTLFKRRYHAMSL